jgi:hypothetical protein
VTGTSSAERFSSAQSFRLQWVGQTPPLRLGAVLKRYAEGSGDFLTPPPPAEKAAARQEQAWKSCTSNGAGVLETGP